MEQTEDCYTTNYPCVVECGHLVLFSYKVCTFCHAPKAEHISKLVLRLSMGLVGANVPEVKLNLKEQDPMDFDATLFVSSIAAAYPELYNMADKSFMNLQLKVFPEEAEAEFNKGLNP